ncbi:MAG: hypothetical protein M0Z55_07770, partial [Peptococcaceae bacterium]|nr:hypothetical protein [Peptococcaceae bacterium]
NHDPGIATSPYWLYRWSDNVHIFHEEFTAVELPELDCVVYGLGFAHFAIKDPLLAGLRIADPDKLNLVVLHGEDHSSPLAGGNSNYLPFTAANLVQAGADYYALGHYHRPKIVWQDASRVRACYAGSPEPLGFSEEGEHGVFCGTVGKESTDLRFVPLNQRTYRTVELRCNGQEFANQLVQLAVSSIPQAERQRDIFRLVYTGEVEPSLEFDRNKLEAVLAPYFFSCRTENDTVPRYDLNGFDRKTARGMFVARMETMLANAVTEEEREIMRQSLYFGLDALNLQKVVER